MIDINQIKPTSIYDLYNEHSNSIKATYKNIDALKNKVNINFEIF